MTRYDATNYAHRFSVPLGKNFFTLTSFEVCRVLEAADAHRYRKPKNANGSRARYFPRRTATRCAEGCRMNAEDEYNFRLRKAVDFLAHCREVEAQARREVTRAAEQTKRAKEKYETLFIECEQREVARRKAEFETA